MRDEVLLKCVHSLLRLVFASLNFTSVEMVLVNVADLPPLLDLDLKIFMASPLLISIQLVTDGALNQ